ncbi:MAG: type II toxin-antitoxin system HicB family antitoxin [Chloroflexi bacterium]|nr:type II toxin-antitoxin system HicB family antitoxin [Chloroflexota bacterium]
MGYHERDSEEGCCAVIVPALPGCVTRGETVQVSVKRDKEAIAGYIESLEAGA